MTKLFIIDDEEPIVRLLMEYFSHFNYECEGYDFNQNLLQSIRSFRPDIIISDMNLHYTNGVEILTQIKKNTDLEHIPFVFLTGSVDDEIIQKGFELGADDCLRKPLDLSEIKLQIEHVLNRRNFRTKKPVWALVLDQNKEHIDNIDKAFSKNGCKVVVADSLEKASEILQKNNIDIVLAGPLMADGEILSFYESAEIDFNRVYFSLIVHSHELEFMKKARSKGVNDFIYSDYGDVYFKSKLLQIIRETNSGYSGKKGPVKKEKRILTN